MGLGAAAPFSSGEAGGPVAQAAGPAGLYKGARPQVAGPQIMLVLYGIILYTELKPHLGTSTQNG